MDIIGDKATPGKITPERFQILLEAGKDILNRPPEIRLKAMLKVAGRGLALKCIEARRDDGSAVPE